MEKIEDNVEDIDEKISPKEYPLLFSFKYILDFYFGDISLETILTLSANSEKGFTNQTAIDVAHEVGLYAVYKDISALNIPKHFLPCIIFDKENKPFILTNKAKEASLLDISTNETITIDSSKLKEYKKAILIFRDKNKSELIDSTKTGNWFWQPVKSFWRSYIEIGILTLFINIFALAVPLFTMSVYDRVVPNNAIETLFVLASGVVIILIFDVYFKSVRNHIIENVGKKLGVYLEEELMKRMLTLKSQYDTLLVGSKANLFKELNQIRDFFATKSVLQVIDLPFFFIAIIVIFLISPAVAAVPFTIAILILIFNVIMQIPISNLSKKMFKIHKLSIVI